MPPNPYAIKEGIQKSRIIGTASQHEKNTAALANEVKSIDIFLPKSNLGLTKYGSTVLPFRPLYAQLFGTVFTNLLWLIFRVSMIFVSYLRVRIAVGYEIGNVIHRDTGYNTN
jgi:hypothetical protein